MTADETGERRVLGQARDRCRRLIDELRLDAADLRQATTRAAAGAGFSAAVSADALADGRVAYERAAAAAEALLRRLEDLTEAPARGETE